MDALTITLVFILIAVGVFLITQVRPHISREVSNEDLDRIARNEELKTLHRMRRQRDRVWFKIDNLYAEFEKRTISEEPTLKDRRPESSPQANDREEDVDNWNDITLAYIKGKYELFLKKN